MAYCKLSTSEFIQEALAPIIGVVCSNDAENICKKNNLTFVELLQPFCRLQAEVQMRDPANVSHSVRNLRLNVKNVDSSPPQPVLAKKLLHDVVFNTVPSTENSVTAVTTVGDYDLQLTGTTTWFEAYRESFLSVLPPLDHEYFKHFIACIFVVSSNVRDPLEELQRLTQFQYRQQHQHAGRFPKWFSPNIFLYYVLLHDVAEANITRAEAVYQSMKSTYGNMNCHFLQINSVLPSAMRENGMGEQTNMPDPWSQFIRRKHDPTSQGGEADALSGSDVQSTDLLGEGGVQTANYSSLDMSRTDDGSDGPGRLLQSVPALDHPLALGIVDASVSVLDQDMDGDGRQEVGSSKGLANTGRQLPGPDGHGACLSHSDRDRLRIFINEFVTHGLAPWAERTLRVLNDQVTAKKGHRSIFSGAKKWFGTTKQVPTNVLQEKASVVYTSDAPEMQMRRQADLYFMFHMYEQAYQTYQLLKRDFNNDHAWLYYAGTLEMSCLSIFMQGSASQKQYPFHHMDSAIATYLTTCNLPLCAERAMLFSTEILKNKSMYMEAAMQFIKMTKEDSDLLSALLLEQAAHCFIHHKVPMVRKYAFHMILAGHRFGKASQRRHALRCYGQAFQVYKGHGWSLAEDDINFTIGRLSYMLQQFDNATAAFKHVLNKDSKQHASQQLAFLQEYLFVYKKLVSLNDGLAGAGTDLPQLPLPVIDGNATKVLSCLAGPVNTVTGEGEVAGSEEMWHRLEQQLIRWRLGHVPLTFQPSPLQYRTRHTVNTQPLLIVIGEPVTIELLIGNPLSVPLQLRHVSLQYRFSAISAPDNAEEGKAIDALELEEVLLDSCQNKKVHLQLVAHRPGQVSVTGFMYELCVAPAPNLAVDMLKANEQAELASMTVRGQLTVDLSGRRLNTTAAERQGREYSIDRRLDFVAVPTMPRLQIEFEQLPTVMMAGEVHRAIMCVSNVGPVSLTQLAMVTSDSTSVVIGARTDSDSSVALERVACIKAQEHVTVSLPPSDTVLPIPVSTLSPHSEASHVSLWLHASQNTGCFDSHWMYYYEPASPGHKMTHRVLRHCHTLTVEPSVVVRAAASRSCRCHRSTAASGLDNSLLVSVYVENISVNSSLGSIEVTQVTCASPQWILECLDSEQSGTVPSIGCRESLTLTFRATPSTSLPQVQQTATSPVSFSDVCLSKTRVVSSSKPLVEFYNATRLSASQPGVDSAAADGLDIHLLVFWQVEREGRLVEGVHLVRVSQLSKAHCAPVDSKVCSEQPALLRSLPVSQYGAGGVSNDKSRLIVYKLDYASEVVNDFAHTRLCCLPISVNLSNCSSTPLTVVIDLTSADDRDVLGSLHKPSAPYLWIGKTAKTLTVAAFQQELVHVQAVFWRPGIYDLSRLRILAASDSATPPSVQQPIAPAFVTVSTVSHSRQP